MRKKSGSAMIEKRMRKCIGSICLAAALCAVCMSPYAQETESEGAVAAKSEMAKVVAVTEDWMVPVTAEELKDGTYDIEVRSSSSMFQITDCTLTVEDGRMSAAMTMGGTGYRYVCMATPEEAAKADEKDFLQFERLVFGSTDGSTLGIACQDEYFDPLTCIGGTSATKDGHFEQTLDSRYPTNITGEEITRRVGALAAEHGCTIHVDIDMVPFLTDPDTPAMQTLVRTYNEYTSRDAKGFCIGGGTYARHFKAGGSFGPNDPAFPMPDWVGAEHSADEGFSEEQFKRALQIYIVSIARLMRLEF